MKKEFYRQNLPHYNTSGQVYFVTWNLQSSVPRHVLKEIGVEMEMAQQRLKYCVEKKIPAKEIQKSKYEIIGLKFKHQKQIERILHNEINPEINLRKPYNLKIIIEALQFWENEKLENISWSIMPNHVHWVFYLKRKDSAEKINYLENLLHSVKRYTANMINKAEGRSGRLWIKESFDITIRNERHLHNTINYTLHNPVKARLSAFWSDWKGNFLNTKYLDEVDDEFGR